MDNDDRIAYLKNLMEEKRKKYYMSGITDMHTKFMNSKITVPPGWREATPAEENEMNDPCGHSCWLPDQEPVLSELPEEEINSVAITKSEISLEKSALPIKSVPKALLSGLLPAHAPLIFNSWSTCVFDGQNGLQRTFLLQSDKVPDLPFVANQVAWRIKQVLPKSHVHIDFGSSPDINGLFLIWMWIFIAGLIASQQKSEIANIVVRTAFSLISHASLLLCGP